MHPPSGDPPGAVLLSMPPLWRLHLPSRPRLGLSGLARPGPNWRKVGFSIAPQIRCSMLGFNQHPAPMILLKVRVPGGLQRLQAFS